jgi:GTP-binding protein
MMTPVIALVGRPNVGKSTLFNRLTRSRDALVADAPGLTRDRQYGQGAWSEQRFIIIDTGGISGDEEGVDALMAKQSLTAADEANIVFFLVDARAGMTAADEEIANYLRSLGKEINLVVNKVDGVDADSVTAEFYALGFSKVYQIAASHGRGVSRLMDDVMEPFVPELSDDEDISEGQESDSDGEEAGAQSESVEQKGGDKQPPASIKMAIIGRPNVGKSTLVNRMLGEERVIAYDMPGTTRDSIYIPLERQGKAYTLIDTAGVRRRGKVKEVQEKFSVIKTLQAIEDADVVVMLLDARDSVTEQDLGLLGFVIDAGRSLVLAVNKWDGMTQEERDKVRQDIRRRLEFCQFARLHFISALHGSGVGDIFSSVHEAHASANKKISTSKLNQVLEHAVAVHQPPMVRGHRIKLRYAHIGGHNPPLFVIHGNQTKSLPKAYQRYLLNHFRRQLRLVGTPLRIELKEGENPFAHKRQKLTPRQQHTKKRLEKQHKIGKKR